MAVPAGGTAQPPSPSREPGNGPERNEVVIKHDDIKGFMPGMTMPREASISARAWDRRASAASCV